MKIDADGHVTLDSGKYILNTKYSGLSLTPDGQLVSGFDDSYSDSEEERLTSAERLEIATFMVNEWLTWAAK